MNAQIEFTSYIPTALVGVNSPSPTLAAEVVTGLPISTGAFPGNVFYLSESWANQLSASAVNGSAIQQCHAGWYMVVQIDSGATAAYLQNGYIVAQADPYTKGAFVLTSADKATALGANPAILIGYPTGGFTPGYYTIVQVSGDANVYLKSGSTGAKGVLITYATGDNGQAGTPTQSTDITYALYGGIVGLLESLAATASGINRVNVSFPFGVI